jgi:hypothetical protein
MEHKGEIRLMLSRTGVLVVGVTSVTRERGRERERERESLHASVSACLVCPASLYVNVCPRERVSTRTYLHVRVVTCLRKALDIPFYRCKEMSSCTTGCSYALRGWRGSALSPVHELTWSSEKCLEPCRSTDVGWHGSC